MKTIFNWTVGSFFRSIGRIVAYLFIGGFIAYLLNRSGFDWGRLIGIEKVSALSITDNVQRSGSDYFTVTNPNDFISYNDFYYTTVSSGWIDRIISYELSPKLTLGTHDYVEIPFITSYPSQTELNYPVQDDFVTCRTWTCDTYSQGVCGQFKCISWYTSGTSTTNDHMLTDYEVNGLSFYAKVIYADSQGNWAGWASCSIQGNSFVCPTEHDKYLSYIQVVINYNPPKSSQFYFGLQRGVNYYRGQQIQQAVEQNTQAINQQTQQQQQQYNDTNSTSESNTASNYFHNQTDDTPSGLTSAITSPLRILDNAIQGNHSDLCFTLNSKQTCIPSGDIIWQNYDSSNSRHHWFDSSFVGGGGSAISKFQSFFNIVVAGYLCYKMLLSMMRIFNNAIDPTVTTIEVMKL